MSIHTRGKCVFNKGGVLSSKRGGMILEATIFLPIFIVAVIVMICCIRVYAIDEYVTFKMCDEMRAVISTAKYTDIRPDSMYRTLNQISSVAPEMKYALLTYMNTDYDDESEDLQDLYAISIQYDIGLNLPIPMTEDLIREKTVVARGFTGRIYVPDGDSEDEIVWVFPDYGECYHDANCRYIKVYPKKKILTSNVKGKSEYCKICNSVSLPAGAEVMIFNSGKYHSRECGTVTKYTVSISLEEAIAGGYKACSKCMN